jgi:transcriptional regulator with XRE-family HTH domain
LEEKDDKKYFDFRPIGRAFKKARDERGWTRENVAEMLNITATHLKAIENHGAIPSLLVFYKLSTIFMISVDEFFFPERRPKSTLYRQITHLLDDCDEKYLPMLKATLLEVAEIDSRDVYNAETEETESPDRQDERG